MVRTAAFHARVRGSVPGLGGLKETKMFLPHPRVKVSIVGSLRDREVACSASDRQGSYFQFMAQFSLYVHKGGLKPDSFHFHFHGCFSLRQLLVELSGTVARVPEGYPISAVLISLRGVISRQGVLTYERNVTRSIMGGGQKGVM